LLYWLLQMLNDTLGTHGVYLSLSALYLLLPITCLRLGWALALVFVTGMLIDAPLPVNFGFHSLLFALVTAFLYNMRHSIGRAGLGQLILVALGVNAFLIVAQSLLLAGPLMGNGLYWLRIGSDLLFSSLALPLIGWWFLSWERWLLVICGCDTHAPENA
ncbi:MAG: hypothetical protein ACQKBW_03280, partial [Puniceicoccales bacterium]